jgi:hypothetical protein
LLTFRVALSTVVLTAVAVPLTVAAPFTTGVAGATIVASPTVVYVDDTDNDGLAGLARATVTNPTPPAGMVIADDDKTDVVEAKLSPDGSRVAVIADFNAASASDTGNLTLMTMNLDGSNRHTLANEGDTASTIAEFGGITWVGNSTIAYAWVHGTFASNSVDLRTVPANGGPITALAGTTGMGDPAGSPDGTQLAVETFDGVNGRIKLLNLSTLASTTIVTVAAFLGEPAWSPDGTAIAYLKDDSDDPAAANPQTATELDVIRNTGSWSAPVTAVPAVKNNTTGSWIDELPHWADNATLYFDRFDISSSVANTASEDLWSTAFDGGTSTWGTATDLTNTTGSSEWNVTVSPADLTAPSNVTVLPAILGGTTITVRWSSPDADFSHVILKRTDQTAGTPQATIGNAFGSSYADKNLVVGHTYVYNFQTVDGAGNTTTDDVDHLVTATKTPVIVSPSPTSTVQRGLPFRVTWGVAGQAPGATYDVDYAVKGGIKWTLGSTFHLLTGTTATSAAFTKGTPGQTYYFRATVHDTHGNASSTTWKGVNVPLDQKSGAFSTGWTTISNTKVYWLGSVASTSKNGATFTIAPTSKSVSIIGTKCAACGKFAVYVDGHYRGTVSSAAKSTSFRQILWTGVNVAIGKHTIKVVAVLAAHQVLQIDGVADPR